MAKSKTEEQLNEYIERLKADLEAAEERANEAEQEVENLKEMNADGRNTWAQPVDWDEKGLPVPRLEMFWSRDSDAEWDCRCLYVLVYRHLLDGVGDKRKIIANPMGLTRSSGASAYGLVSSGRDEINVPFRDGAHAFSDAKQLGLPLYVTTEDGDVDQYIVGETREERRVVKLKRTKRAA